VPHAEDLRKNECRTGHQRRIANQEDVALAYASEALIPRLSEVEGAEELSISRAQAPGARGAEQVARDRCVLTSKEDRMDKPENVADILAIPLPEERRRSEIMLARVLLLAVDHVVFGEPLGLGTARDLVREIKHSYPELRREWNDL